MTMYPIALVFVWIFQTGQAVALNNYETVLAEQMNRYCEAHICQGGRNAITSQTSRHIQRIGKAGPRGPVGSSGPRGEPGIRGAIGPVGKPGARGMTGSPGPMGEPGARGMTGAPGPVGDPGARGITGAPGPVIQVNYTKIEEIMEKKISRYLSTLSNGDCSSFDSNELAVVQNDTGGVFVISPNSVGGLIKVYCDLTTDGGKWMVFQRRFNGMVDFASKNWNDYVNGFGDPTNEYWMGLEKLHQLTSNGEFELRIDLEDWEGNKRYAKYRNFHIGSAATKYQLNIGSYQGDARDSLTNHNGMKFTTRDEDNDGKSSGNCASKYNSGGWWINNCFVANLNGKYIKQAQVSRYLVGVIWYHWKGYYYSLKSTEMKFRPMV